MTSEQQIAKLYGWAFTDNGIKSADKRIVENTERLESAFNGERRCVAMKEINKHTAWHERSKRFQWGTMIPVYLTLGVILLQIFGVIQ